MKLSMEAAKAFLKTPKGMAAVSGGGAVVAGTAVAIGLVVSSQAYRTIAVEEVNGTSIIQNERQESNNAYAGMHLNSGDDVTVQTASDMTLLLDMDKYVYAEENTHFWLEAEGNPETSRTRIYLDQGAELNRLETTLAEGETYEVDTPNSVMAVRGTVFRVCIYYDDAGLAYASAEVYDGDVEIRLKTLGGEFNGVSEVVGAGESVLIRASDDFSEFVADGNGNVKRPISYKEIPQNTARKLVEFIDDGEELCIGKELLMDYTKLEEHKMEEVITEEATCSKEGRKELLCTVCNEVEETVVIPRLPHEVPEEWEIAVEPDCVNPGSEQKVCTVCGEVIETREIDALGHMPGEFIVTTEATCTQQGEQVSRCCVCGEIIQREVMAALGHIPGDWQTTGSASCTSAGSQSRTCSRCGNIETAAIARLPHTFSPVRIADHMEGLDGLFTDGTTLSENMIILRECTECGAAVEETHTITRTITSIEDTGEIIETYHCDTCDKDLVF